MLFRQQHFLYGITVTMTAAARVTDLQTRRAAEKLLCTHFFMYAMRLLHNMFQTVLGGGLNMARRSDIASCLGWHSCSYCQLHITCNGMQAAAVL